MTRGPESFDRAPHTRARGAAAEDDAVAWLKRRGYRVLERNVRNAGGEIDLVARDGDVLCFVEIKARATDAYGPAVAAVDRRKQRRIARAAAVYLATLRGLEPLCRFDVLGMDREGDGWRFTLLQDAFQTD